LADIANSFGTVLSLALSMVKVGDSSGGCWDWKIAPFCADRRRHQ
jgi:hypothetical protein